jgi:hypothetical protein
MSITPLLKAEHPARPAAGYKNAPALPDNAAIEQVEAERELSPQVQAVIEHWNGLLVDCTGDELGAGGQSLRELERLEAFEGWLATLDLVEVPTFHHFAEGLYIREIHAPQDTVLIGHEHHDECWNVMQRGLVLTINNGTVSEFRAPVMVKSGAHTRKASVVVEDMIWATIHPNPDNETDIAKLEERLLIKSRTFLAL